MSLLSVLGIKIVTCFVFESESESIVPSRPSRLVVSDVEELCYARSGLCCGSAL